MIAMSYESTVELDSHQKYVLTHWLNSEYISHETKATVMSVLRLLNIEVAYDWVGHRGEYFFPTVEDKMIQEDWLFQCMD